MLNKYSAAIYDANMILDYVNQLHHPVIYISAECDLFAYHSYNFISLVDVNNKNNIKPIVKKCISLFIHHRTRQDTVNAK